MVPRLAGSPALCTIEPLIAPAVEPRGVLGRNILNQRRLLLDGPRRQWDSCCSSLGPTQRTPTGPPPPVWTADAPLWMRIP